jgi:predicted Mrr-cat superfamily restriction endonuclease
MANRRNLKKDIQFLTSQLIVDAVEIAEQASPEVQDEIIKIISNAAVLHNDLIVRINHVDGKDNPKMVKQFFKAIVDDLLKGMDALYSQLTVYVKN